MEKLPIVEMDNISTRFGNKQIHKELNLKVNPGEVLALVGGSGSGKTVLLREMIGLMQPTSGRVRVFGNELGKLNSNEKAVIQSKWGVLFQQNALFSSMNILENTAFPLHERTKLDVDVINQLALFKIVLAGLSPDVAILMPSELSGGMQKRAALARAMVLDPELLFLDEPTAGLDPGLVASFDKLILSLQRSLSLTIVMVTHDVQSIRRTANRVAFLGEGRVLCVGPLEEVMRFSHPLVHDFFVGF